MYRGERNPRYHRAPTPLKRNNYAVQAKLQAFRQYDVCWLDSNFSTSLKSLYEFPRYPIIRIAKEGAYMFAASFRSFVC